MLKNKWKEIYNHLIGWLIFMSLPLVFMARDSKDALQLLHSYPYWTFLTSFFFIFYIGYYYLIPRFFLQNHYIYFSLSIFLLLTAVFVLRPFDHLMSTNRRFDRARPARELRENPRFDRGQQPGASRPDLPPPHKSRRIDIVSIFLFILAIVLAMAVKVTAQWRKTEQRALQAESDRVKAELSFLKAQINPHFLFNTLNNIYTLSMMHHPNTSESIMKLSNIMRYVTDDVNQDFVPLRDEIACISDYIDLQKLRLGKMSPLEFTVKGQGIESKRIAPLILMTFIENTFKYGVSKKEESPILISIEVEETIHFKCINRLFEKKSKESTGIGIDNTVQRLKHVYGDKFKLEINQDNGMFEVNLQLS